MACGKLKFLATTSKWSATTLDVADAEASPVGAHQLDIQALGGITCSASGAMFDYTGLLRSPVGLCSSVIGIWKKIPMTITSTVTTSSEPQENWTCSLPSCQNWNNGTNKT